MTEIVDHCVRRLLCLDGPLAEALRDRLLRTTVRLFRGPTLIRSPQGHSRPHGTGSHPTP